MVIEQSSPVATACKSLHDTLLELLAQTIMSYDIYPIKLYGKLSTGDLVGLRLIKYLDAAYYCVCFAGKKNILKKTVLVKSLSSSGKRFRTVNVTSSLPVSEIKMLLSQQVKVTFGCSKHC